MSIRHQMVKPKRKKARNQSNNKMAKDFKNYEEILSYFGHLFFTLEKKKKYSANTSMGTA